MKILVLGGGASGMMAAIYAVREGAEVIIIENKDRVGKKLSATGNGRCNLTNQNLRINPENYYNLSSEDKPKVKDIFTKAGVDKVIEEFKTLGLLTKCRGELVYPHSDQAESVCQVMENYLLENGAEIKLNTLVKDIKSIDNGFFVTTSEGEYTCDKVICSMGSKAAPKLGGMDKGYYLLSKLGHTVNKTMPGLTKLCADGKIYKKVSGVRVNAKLSIIKHTSEGDKCIYSESGELQFTDYGISGVVSMNISNRWGADAKDSYILVDMAEDYSDDELYDYIFTLKNTYKDRPLSVILNGLLPDRLSNALVDLTIDKDKDIVSSLVELIKRFRVDVTSLKDYEDAQISLGGIPILEVSNELESNKTPGLYITGELLDVHGGCGGYNLQWAFSTGMIAGSAAAKS